jgi:4-hydroxybenzoate polyprenyltransferase
MTDLAVYGARLRENEPMGRLTLNVRDYGWWAIWLLLTLAVVLPAVLLDKPEHQWWWFVIVAAAWIWRLWNQLRNELDRDDEL